MTERQSYEVIKKIEDFEIRRYDPYVAAEVNVNSDFNNAGSIGFRPLVTYISRNNIAMTAPVIQEDTGTNSWKISFVMPQGIDKSDLPAPKDTNVLIRQIDESYCAVISFRGSSTQERVQKIEIEFKAKLQKYEIEPIGESRLARFDPPWKPGFLKYNEIVIPINY
jgi:hypothetical protein